MNLLNKLFVTLLMGSALTLVACNQNDGGGGGGQPAPAANPAVGGYASTPQPCNTQQGGNPNCQAGYYGGGYGQHVLPQAWQHGAWQWPTQWQPQIGNCGCQSGYKSVYHQSFGLACAPQAYFGGGGGSGYGYGGGGGYSYVSYGVSVGIFFNWGASNGPAVNNQNLNIPQTYYGNSCGGNSAPAQGCDTRQYRSCGRNLVCQPVGAGSSIGVCVRDYYYF